MMNSLNIAESIRISAEIYNQIICLIFIIYFLTKVKNINHFITYIVMLIASIELASVYYPYLQDILEQGKPTERSLAYRGISGSINIIAYTLLMKLPFIYYFAYMNKRKFIYFLYSILISFAVIGILETRSAILCLIVISGLCFFFFIKYEGFNKNYKKALSTILLPIIISILFSNIQSRVFNSVNVQDRLETLTRLQGDDSLNERIRYSLHALSSIKKNPILGIGIGNWELVSIDYDKEDIVSYVVPYHVHNDYLELIAETGIPGFLLYYGAIFIVLFKLLKPLLFKSKINRDEFINCVIALSIIVYLIDATFNFPFARTMQQMSLIFLISLAIVLNNFSLKYSKFNFLLIILIFIPLSLYSSARLYKASIEHRVLLVQFNNKDASYPSLDQLSNYEKIYPNITPTTLSITALEGYYHINALEYTKALPFLHESRKHNPFLHFSETYLSLAHYRLGNLDSARYWSEIAFNKLPNNILHYVHYMAALTKQGDSIAIKESLKKVNKKIPMHDEIYLTAMGGLGLSDGGEFALEDFDIDYSSGSDKLKRGYYMLKIGQDEMYQADVFYQMGEADFAAGNFSGAAQNFLKASELNPLEVPYKENIANAYMQLSKFDKALDIVDEILLNDDYRSEKIIYMRGLILYNLGQIDAACIVFKELENARYIGPRIYNSLCKN